MTRIPTSARETGLDGDTVAFANAIHDPYPSSTRETRLDGDTIAIGNAIEAQTLAAAEALRTPYNSPGVFGEAVKTANVADVKFVPGVTDFPATPQTAPDNRVERALKQGPQVIPYLSQGMTSDDVVGVRPDDRADRFAHSDVSPRPQMATAQRLDDRLGQGPDGGVSADSFSSLASVWRSATFADRGSQASRDHLGR